VLKANVTPEAGHILDEWLTAQGITIGPFLEAFAEAVDRDPDVTGRAAEVLQRARRIERERRRRE
jgi:hypothetical protein